MKRKTADGRMVITLSLYMRRALALSPLLQPSPSMTGCISKAITALNRQLVVEGSERPTH
jgi:hypothetical protein